MEVRRSKRRKDMLSRLPVELLDRILCLLPQKEAVRTCVLSKSWRYLGPTRSKLELSESHSLDRKKDRFRFISVLGRTLETHNRRNLPPPFLYLKMTIDPIIIPFDLRSLRELHLLNFYLDPKDYFNDTRLKLGNLRKLILECVSIDDQTLELLLSKCPTIESLQILNFPQLMCVKAKNALTLKHFVLCRGSQGHHIKIEIPNLETARLVKSSHRLLHDQHFPLLRSVYLEKVELSRELFRFFKTDYMPRLEELELNQCEGFKESIHLSTSSIKHLRIACATVPFNAIIDAPSIVCLIIKAHRRPSPRSRRALIEMFKATFGNETCHYFWNKNQGLMEISVEAYCSEANEWRPVQPNTLSHRRPKIRLGLKWRQTS